MFSVFFFLKGCWLVVFKNICFDTTIYFNLKMNKPKHVKYSNEIQGFCDFEAYCGCLFRCVCHGIHQPMLDYLSTETFLCSLLHPYATPKNTEPQRGSLPSRASVGGVLCLACYPFPTSLNRFDCLSHC